MCSAGAGWLGRPIILGLLNISTRQDPFVGTAKVTPVRCVGHDRNLLKQDRWLTCNGTGSHYHSDKLACVTKPQWQSLQYVCQVGLSDSARMANRLAKDPPFSHGCRQYV